MRRVFSCRDLGTKRARAAVRACASIPSSNLRGGALCERRRRQKFKYTRPTMTRKHRSLTHQSPSPDPNTQYDDASTLATRSAAQDEARAIPSALPSRGYPCIAALSRRHEHRRQVGAIWHGVHGQGIQLQAARRLLSCRRELHRHCQYVPGRILGGVHWRMDGAAGQPRPDDHRDEGEAFDVLTYSTEV